jgi:hypothetical protein
MIIAIPRWLAPLLVGAGIVSIILALIVTIRAYVRLRRGGYYVIREEARRIALRGSLLVVVFSILTIGAVFFPRQAPAPGPTPTVTVFKTPTPIPTRVEPTRTATATPTPQPTATEPFIPTSTAQATLPAAFSSPLPAAVPAPGDARFEFWTLAQGADGNSQPEKPSSQFPVGIKRVYLFFRYDGLLPNVPWTTIWYRNGEILSGGTSRWESARSAGEWHVYLEFKDGYPRGEYEVQVWLDERLQIRASFSIASAEG